MCNVAGVFHESTSPSSNRSREAGCGCGGQLAWAHIKALVDDAMTVTEESIVSAMRWMAECANLVVEPSGAVAAAALLEHTQLRGQGTIVAIAALVAGNSDCPTRQPLTMHFHWCTC
jgi:threonine dehydratase